MTEAKPFIEVEPDDSNDLALKCPECGSVRHRRRDAIAVGLHYLICIHCGHGTDAIKLRDGMVLEKKASDHA